MAAIAGLQDFRQEGPPADIGTYQLPCEVLVFQHTFAGATYVCAIRAGVRGWVLVDYGTVVGTVINNAISALTAGRTWKEKVVLKGNFTIAAQINVPSHTFIEIQGCIKVADGSSTTMNVFELAGNTDIVIMGGEIDGNKANQADGGDDEYQDGIHGYNASDVLIEGVYIHDCKYTGILFSHVYTGAWRVTVSHNRIKDCGLDGVHFHLGTYCIICNNIITGSVTANGIYTFLGSENTIADNVISEIAGTNGITVLQGNRTTISGNVVHHSDDSGIGLDTAEYITVVGNAVKLSEGSGIDLTAATHCVIAHNVVMDSNQANWTYDGVKLRNTSTYNVIEGNIIGSTTATLQRYGYDEEAAADDYNRVFENVIFGYGTAAARPQGTHDVIKDNLGYNPVGNIATPYSVGAGFLLDVAGAQAFPTSNTNYTVGQSPKLVTIYGGTVTSISIDGVATGLTSGAFRLEPGQVLNVVWTVQPSSQVYAQ